MVLVIGIYVLEQYVNWNIYLLSSKVDVVKEFQVLASTDFSAVFHILGMSTFHAQIQNK